MLRWMRMMAPRMRIPPITLQSAFSSLPLTLLPSLFNSPQMGLLPNETTFLAESLFEKQQKSEEDGPACCC